MTDSVGCEWHPLTIQFVFHYEDNQCYSSDNYKFVHNNVLYIVQWVPQLFERLDSFHVNKSCKIECCGNKTHQIIQNMILSRGLELKLSLL